MERTFAIIKPDAVSKGFTGKIIDRIESEGFTIIGMKKVKMDKATAEKFYEVHKERPFYGDLTDFMSSGPAVVMAMKKDGAIKAWRDLMGATNPKEAEAGTLRKDFGESIDNNAVHGSDAPETAAVEIPFFFKDSELVG